MRNSEEYTRTLETIEQLNDRDHAGRCQRILSANIDSKSKAVLLSINYLAQGACAVEVTIETVAAYTSLHRRTISRRIEGLKQAGMLAVQPPSKYQILWQGLDGAYRYQSPDRDTSYQDFRDFVFARDNHQCVYCGSIEALCLDHVIPQSKGGSSTPKNLVTACRSCNSAKRDRTPQEWLGGAK